MSIREAIINRLLRNDISIDGKVVVEDVVQNGLPATKVTLNLREPDGVKMTKREWTFADVNKMNSDHIADVVLSYILRGRQ